LFYSRVDRIHQHGTAELISVAQRQAAGINLDTFDDSRVDRTENILEVSRMIRVEQFVAVQEYRGFTILATAEIGPGRYAGRCQSRQYLHGAQRIVTNIGKVLDRKL